MEGNRFRPVDEALADDRWAMVAHDLRAPLTCIRGFAELLSDPECDPRLGRLGAKVILSSVDFMRRLLDDLAALYLSERGELRIDKVHVRLDRLLEDSIELFGASFSARGATISLRSRPCAVLGDATRLRQVLNNLLDNALEHVPKGGRVDVRLRAFERMALVEISNQGSSMDSADMAGAFQKFYRGRHESRAGTGLGLHIAKLIIEGHGGKIGVRVRCLEPETLFYFMVPRPGG